MGKGDFTENFLRKNSGQCLDKKNKWKIKF